MPSSLESTTENPQIRYAWEDKKTDQTELAVADKYEDIEEEETVSEIKTPEFGSVEPDKPERLEISFVKSTAPEENSAVEDEKVKMLETGEEKPEEIIPIKIGSETSPVEVIEEKKTTEEKDTDPIQSEGLSVEQSIALEDSALEKRLDFLSGEIVESWEKYKINPNRDLIGHIDFEEITEKTPKEKDQLRKIVEESFRSAFRRSIIDEEKEKLAS